MRTGQMGLSALAFLTLLFTIPTAFAQVSGDNPALENSNDNANAKFVLMEKITAAQEEYDTLETLITSNGLNMGKGLAEYADALDMAVKLAEDSETLDDAAAILDGSQDILDDIYTQLDAQIDSRQNERFEDFVVRAESSIGFILTNADVLGISQAVYDELEKTLAILQSGSYEEILAATSEESNLGLTVSMFPKDHSGFGNATPNNNGRGKGLGLGEVPPGLQKLPPEIKKKYEISSDNNLGSQISNVNDETNVDGQTNGNDNSDFFDSLPGFGKSSENGQSNGKGQGVGLGVEPEASSILKKDEAWLYDHGIIIDDSWKHPFEDDDFSKGKGQEKKGKGPPEDKGKSCKGGACAQGQGSGQGQSDEPPGKNDEPPRKNDEPPRKNDEPPGKNKNKP